MQIVTGSHLLRKSMCLCIWLEWINLKGRHHFFLLPVTNYYKAVKRDWQQMFFVFFCIWSARCGFPLWQVITTYWHIRSNLRYIQSDKMNCLFFSQMCCIVCCTVTLDGVSGQNTHDEIYLHTAQPNDSEQLLHKWAKATAHKAVWASTPPSWTLAAAD